MKIEFAARVDIGPKATNDDRVIASGEILDMTSHSGETELPALFAVCDGCGGYAGGGIAAGTVLEFLSFESPEALEDVNYLAQVLENCKNVVFEKKEEMPHFSAMCTTVAGCVFSKTGTVIFHAGDSRVYRYDKWGLTRITRDHSIVQEMVDAGELTDEEARNHPKRNVISRCIGIDCPPPDIHLSASPIAPGDKYLFCSDGLWEIVTDAEIKSVLESELTLEQMADKLIDMAIANGADDNISVCICRGQGVSAEEKETTPFILD